MLVDGVICFVLWLHFYEAVLVPHLSEFFLFLSRSNEKFSPTVDRSVSKICKSGQMLSHPKVFHPPG